MGAVIIGNPENTAHTSKMTGTTKGTMVKNTGNITIINTMAGIMPTGGIFLSTTGHMATMESMTDTTIEDIIVITVATVELLFILRLAVFPLAWQWLIPTWPFRSASMVTEMTETEPL